MLTLSVVTPTGHTLVVYSCAWFGTDPTFRLVQSTAAANKTPGVNEEWTPIRQTRAEPHGRFRSVPCRPRVPTTAGARSDRPGEEQTGERRLGAEPTQARRRYIPAFHSTSTRDREDLAWLGLDTYVGERRGDPVTCTDTWPGDHAPCKDVCLRHLFPPCTTDSFLEYRIL